MAHSQYPREITHPNGWRIVTVFDADEEKKVRAEHQKFIAEQTKAAALAARSKQEIV